MEKKDKKSNVVIELFKLMGVLLVSTLFWDFVFSFIQDGEEVVEPFPGAFFLFGIITSLVLLVIVKYNNLSKLNQKAKSEYSNIKVLLSRSKTLLEKANKVADKQMAFESETQVGVAKERTQDSGNGATAGGMITNAISFKEAIEKYPELQSNNSVAELLRQIQDCENASASQKIKYNAVVEEYNSQLHSFPNSLFNIFYRFEDREFYNEVLEESIVSDESLGI